MNDSAHIRVDGEIANPLSLGLDDFRTIPAEHQIDDVTRLDPNRKGVAVTLEGFLQRVQPNGQAKFIGLHASADNFHASVPLEAIRARAVLIYQQEGEPLPTSAGGPLRLLIPDPAVCQTAEIDECANVKFIDHIEFTSAKGFDNRPQDEDEHAKLHAEADHSHDDHDHHKGDTNPPA